jgi:hypothetical protein
MSGLTVHNLQFWPRGLEILCSFVAELSAIQSLQNAGSPREQEDIPKLEYNFAFLVLQGLNTTDSVSWSK